MLITLRIEGMHCAACVRRVTQALSKTPSTEVEQVWVGAARVRTAASAEVIMAALANAGYTAHSE